MMGSVYWKCGSLAKQEGICRIISAPDSDNLKWSQAQGIGIVLFGSYCHVGNNAELA